MSGDKPDIIYVFEIGVKTPAKLGPGAGAVTGHTKISHAVAEPVSVQLTWAVVPVRLLTIKFVGAGHCAVFIKLEKKAAKRKIFFIYENLVIQRYTEI